MEHDIPFGISNRENGTTFLDFPLFLGIFQWDEPTKRVPFTVEPEIPEILTKWKAPTIPSFTQDTLYDKWECARSFMYAVWCMIAPCHKNNGDLIRSDDSDNNENVIRAIKSKA